MNYSEPLINQVTVFFRSVGAGIILGIIYDALCFLRMVTGEKKSIYVTFDIIFSLTATLISFFFMVLYNTGQVRFNLMVGEFLGGVAFHLSLGRYFLESAQRYITKVRKIFLKVFSPLIRIFKKISGSVKETMKKYIKREDKGKNIKKTHKKFSNIRKILLKNQNKSV